MMKNSPARNAVAAVLAAAGAFGILAAAQSAPLNIAPEPLGTSTTSIQPNVMFILDDSGSMAWDYMPNIVVDSDSPPGTTAGCFDSGDDSDGSGSGKIDGGRNRCVIGDPPYMSTDFNNIMYDPGTWYRPGVNYDGTDMTTQNAANTTSATGPYTRVLSDAYIGGGAVTDLVNNYPDRVWCIAKADAAASGNCRQNTAYRYPDAVFPFGEDSSGNEKYVFGAPYYYRMQTSQWCDTAARTNCKSGSAATAGTYTFNAPEFCSDVELTTCVAGAAVDPAVHKFSGIRWCSDANTLLKCQRKKVGAFVYPKHLGTTASQTVAAPGLPAIPNEGNIKVTSVNAAGATISSIQIGGIDVSGPIAIPAGTSAATAAGLITSAINTFASTPDYIVVLPQTGLNAVVQNAVAGATGAGLAITINANQIGTTSSVGRVTVNSSSAPTVAGVLTGLTVNGVAMLCTTALAPGPTTFGGSIVNASGTISHASLNSNTKRSDFRNAIQSRVNLCAAAAALNNGYTTTTGNSGSGSSVNYYVNLIAPVSQGAAPNGQVVTKLGTSTNVGNLAFSNMGAITAGASSPAIVTTTANMTGGQDAFVGTRTVRIGTGLFSRTDIVPSNNSYAKGNGRIDCAGAACSYDEEMTNFANWYAYYHTRLQMAKTAIGRAFLALDDNFRVGFITINPGSPVDTTNKYLKIANFTVGAGNHKQDWYNVLYNADTVNSTPLREALSRVGWIFAGKLDTGLTSGIPTADDPMIASCQPNFAILSTDGYWNSAGGQKLDGSPMDTQDSNIGLTPRPYYDGGAVSTVINTDVYTYAVAAPNTNGCSSGRVRILETITTTTETLQYNASGTLTSDVTVGPSVDTHNFNATCYVDAATATAAMPAGFTDATTTNTNTAGSGSTGALADVAMYYYLNDLRTSGPYAANNVPITNKDNASYQHMVTFTFGLGLDGQLSYDPQYETQISGDFFNLKQGPSNWPAPAQNSPSALDDLWHAAVNGRGVFFSAKNPAELANGLSETLNQLTVRVGAGAAAATSNLQPVAGDNFAFTAQYQTGDWIGDLKARTIDLGSGIVSSVQLWSAASQLDSAGYTVRNIYTFDALDPVVLTTATAAGNQLKNFCWPAEGDATCSDGAGLTLGEQAFFNPTLLTAYSTAMTANQQSNASAQRMVNFLRGDTSYEDTKTGADTDVFHDRLSKLGDIINAQPSYVRKSPFSYADTGYLSFRACTEGTGTGCLAAQFADPSFPRRGTVYVAANDGMLHAFETDVNNNAYFQTAGITTAQTNDDTFAGNNAGNGVERWAYIPSMVMPRMYKLAEKNASHTYLVDGSPQVGDICVSTPCASKDDWRTILVAGLNSGGMGYYALDVTNPLAPKALWEFKNGATCYSDALIDVGDKTTDCNLGLTYGNAIITKRATDGKWVVIVTSGYNNTVNSGDGMGHLYILDAVNGNILKRLNTPAGGTGTPSGLGKIAAWTTNASTDNTALSIYGGDLQGNLWRFQLDPNARLSATDPVGSAYLAVTLVAVAKDSAGNRQPITVKPELGDYASKRIILFGTGQFLQEADKLAPFTTQSIYGLRDDPTQYPDVTVPTPEIPDVRAGSDVRVRQFIAGSVADTRTVASGTAPNWATEHGWLIDLLPANGGERVNVDPQLQLGTLVIASNTPSADSCTAGGFSFINFLDYATGSYIPGSANNMASVKIASSLTVGLNVVMLPGGAVKTIVTTADNQQLSQDTPLPPRNFTGRRVSWRELLIDK